MYLPELFNLYLKTQNASPVTIKNYTADLRHFFNWLGRTTNIKYQIAGKSIFGLFTQETIGEYKSDQLANSTPVATINRRLSALRKLGQFAQSQGWLKDNPAGKIANLTSPSQNPNEDVLAGFKNFLTRHRTNEITVKNYLSDLRHFLNWIEQNG